MAEENKTQNTKDKAEVKPVEVKPTPEVKQETPPKPKAPVAKERPANCAACNKSIKKKRWYYRNGKCYCTKRCWKTTVKKEEKPKEGEAKETPK